MINLLILKINSSTILSHPNCFEFLWQGSLSWDQTESSGRAVKWTWRGHCPGLWVADLLDGEKRTSLAFCFSRACSGSSCLARLCKLNTNTSVMSDLWTFGRSARCSELTWKRWTFTALVDQRSDRKKGKKQYKYETQVNFVPWQPSAESLSPVRPFSVSPFALTAQKNGAESEHLTSVHDALRPEGGGGGGEEENSTLNRSVPILRSYTLWVFLAFPPSVRCWATAETFSSRERSLDWVAWEMKLTTSSGTSVTPSFLAEDKRCAEVWTSAGLKCHINTDVLSLLVPTFYFLRVHAHFNAPGSCLTIATLSLPSLLVCSSSPHEEFNHISVTTNPWKYDFIPQ